MSLLEQVAALGGGTVTSSGVATALGLADHEVFDELVEVIKESDAARGLEIVARLASRGSDLRRFVADAIGHFRGIFLAQYAENIEDVVDVSSEAIAEWKRQATMLSSAEVLRSIEELSTTLLHLREGREERLVVEIAIIKLTRPETVESVEGLTARIGRLERTMNDLQKTGVSPPVLAEAEPGPTDRPFTSTTPPAATPAVPQPTETAAVSQPAPSAAGNAATTSDPAETSEPQQKPTVGTTVSMADFERAWPAIMADIRQTVGPRRQALLREARPKAMQGSTVVFEVAAHMHFHLEQLKADKGIAEAVNTAAQEHLGTSLGVTFRSAEAVEIEPDREDEEVPDKDDLLSADGEEAVDPVAVVADILDGQIVGE
jgi:DNA polymerase-3 subunit gamma/tau